MNPIRTQAKYLVIIVAAGAALITGYNIVTSRRAPQRKEASTPMPPIQAEFCKTIAAADAAYEPENKAWYAETNAVAQDQLTPKLAAMREKRDLAVLKLLGGENPHMDGWIMRFKSLATSEEQTGQTVVDMATIEMAPGCPNDVTVTAEVPAVGHTGAVLARLKTGDLLRVSGAFLAHDAIQVPFEQAIDWDAFQRTAMHTPSYRIKLTGLQPYQR